MTDKEVLSELKYKRSRLIKSLSERDYEVYSKAIKALENQKTLQEELEKIKAEISKLTRYYTTESGNINLVSDNAVYRIINKHISELKGENK